MKKRLIGSLLLGAFLVASTSMFVSCKDYDDDIKDLQAQIDANKNSLKELQARIQQGSILKSVTPVSEGTGGIDIVITKDGKDETYKIRNGANGTNGTDGINGTNGTNGTDGTPGTVWTIKENFWYVDKGDGKGAQKTEYRAVPTVYIKDGYWYINDEKTDVKAQGEKGEPGTPGTPGEDGQPGTPGESGQPGTANIDVKIGDNGNWYINGKDTGKSSKGADGAPGAPGTNGNDGQDGKYYVPNGNGTFDIYQNGVKIESTSIKYWADGTVTATKSDSELKLFGVNGDYTNAVTISLNGALKSLVFVPHLYLDGIEAIQYKWIGDTILKKYEYRYTITNTPYRSHHRANTGTEQWKKVAGEMDDYLPNRLARHYVYDNANGPRNEIGEDEKSLEAASAYDASREWIYGPVWPVEYHLNPSSSRVVYDESNPPSFNVLEPDVIYYNTRAAQTVLNITSPKKYEYWNKDVDVYGIQDGILTVGLKIEHPQYLAPWPTDETINPNGNTGLPTDGSTVSYPAYPGDDDYGHNIPGANSMGYYNEGNPNGAAYNFPWADWYGYAKYIYNKDNKDNTIALQIHNEDGAENVITSDYALIVPTRATLEALVWAQEPMYAEPNIPGRAYGPQDRIGDEEGWAADEYGSCLTGEKARVHIYDSPEEALADPDGAALELDIDPAGLDLTPYVAVHMLVENLKKKETAPGVFNVYNYDIVKVPYGEEKKWGLHYEWELVEYTIDNNVTSDSRYAMFKDWNKTETHTYAGNGSTYEIVKDWNASTDQSGVIIARDITPDGKTCALSVEKPKEVVDREPLVRVMLKNAKGDVLLDGYILLHIRYLPDNLEITTLPVEDRDFNLCDPLSWGDNWSESSRIILTESAMLSRMAFDDMYWADCMPDPNGTLVKDLVCPVDGSNHGINDIAYVTPDAYRVAMQDNTNYAGATNSPFANRGLTHNEHGIYQLKIFNFGDLYGNKKGDTSNGTKFNPASAPINGSADYETSNDIEKKALGDAEFWANGDGNTNFVFYWTLSEEEIEALTHDKAEPVYVTRWFRFLAKDVKRGRPVNEYTTKWPYIWVRMTMKITRKPKDWAYEQKDDNYWYHYQTGAANNGWSGVLLDIEAPEYKEQNQDQGRVHYTYFNTIKDKRWIKNLSDNLVTNKIKFGANDNRPSWKYYFAPKPYEITARNGVTYIITPKRNANDNSYDKLFCKYVYPHNYANFGNANWDSYLPDPAEVKANSDAHTWDEATLKETLAKCAIIYSNEYDEAGNVVRDAGVFNDTILYANRKGTDEYTPIAKINFQYQFDADQNSYRTAGQVELIHWLKDNGTSTYAGRTYPVGGNPSIDETDVDNLVCYDVLNAIGYPMNTNDNEWLADDCDYDHSRNHIGSNDWNKENAALGTDNQPKNGYVNAGSENQKIQLYSWLGVVRDNGCNVAEYVEQKQNDGPIATFKASWERPINLLAPTIDPAIDAKTDENVIYLIKFLKLFDWRGIKDPKWTDDDAWGYMWNRDEDNLPDHTWFWAYYNVHRIDLDMRTTSITTNLNSTQRSAANEWVPLADVTDTYDINHLILRPLDENGNWLNMGLVSYTNWGGTDEGFVDVVQNTQYEENANKIIRNRMGLDPILLDGTELTKSQIKQRLRRFGAIFYKNDGGNVTDFDIRIPMTIWYEWGYLDYNVTIHVAGTAGRTE